MEAEFWIKRWQDGKIGFHRSEVHPFLEKYFSQFEIDPGDKVFVPLCGKSLDMVWLANDQRVDVLGVELSEVAVGSFFKELGVTPKIESGERHCWYSTSSISVALGDFFAMSSDDLRGVRAVYDRACLIALPPAMRARYATKLGEIVEKGSRMLLITIDHQEARAEGPPFAVSRGEVETLFSKYQVKKLGERVVPVENPRLKELGLKEVQEEAFLISC